MYQHLLVGMYIAILRRAKVKWCHLVLSLFLKNKGIRFLKIIWILKVIHTPCIGKYKINQGRKKNAILCHHPTLLLAFDVNLSSNFPFEDFNVLFLCSWHLVYSMCSCLCLFVFIWQFSFPLQISEHLTCLLNYISLFLWVTDRCQVPC